MTKIITFNVNGIRAALKKGLEEWLKVENPDILCLQEIKLSETELVEHIFVALGYYCYWYPAVKKGYSGVAILSKIKPTQVTYGCGNEQYDSEGRILIADFESFKVISAYFPSGTSGDSRQEVKMQFLEHIFSFIEAEKMGSDKLLICGDVNICHTEIDIHNPKANAKTSGFLPEERAWVGKFIEAGYVDSFRELNKEPHQYTWWSYRAGARGKNLGWRIDYIFTSETLRSSIVNTHIHADVHMSDHCPVSVTINV